MGIKHMAHCEHFKKIYLYMVETEKGATTHKLTRNANIPSPFTVDSRTVAAFMCWVLRAHVRALHWHCHTSKCRP